MLKQSPIMAQKKTLAFGDWKTQKTDKIDLEKPPFKPNPNLSKEANEINEMLYYGFVQITCTRKGPRPSSGANPKYQEKTGKE